jgi:DNA-binding MurR/RpiR family transcriptional regulator
MKAQLGEQLRERFLSLTRAEKSVANYMLANMNNLPFETAASIAESVGVSQMTVSRFLRTLGFQGLGELKESLRHGPGATPLSISDRVDRIRKQSSGDGGLWDNFELEMQAILGVYELRGTLAWRRTIECLAAPSEVFVGGFQTIGGMAADFAGRLEYVRPNVRFLDGKNGTFGELLAGGAVQTRSLVLFEMRRYSKLSHQLARAALDGGIPLAIICDNHCYWARDYTENVLSVRTDSKLFWDSQAAFLTLTNLLLDDLIASLGPEVKKRLEVMRMLQQKFEAFQD